MHTFGPKKQSEKRFVVNYSFGCPGFAWIYGIKQLEEIRYQDRVVTLAGKQFLLEKSYSKTKRLDLFEGCLQFNVWSCSRSRLDFRSQL